MATADGLIGATAIEHNLVIVTRNVTDFRNLRPDDYQPLGRVGPDLAT